MTDRNEGSAGPPPGQERSVPPPPARRTSPAEARRRRIRRALSSAPQLRDMVIIQEVLERPLGLRDRRS